MGDDGEQRLKGKLGEAAGYASWLVPLIGACLWGIWDQWL